MSAKLTLPVVATKWSPTSSFFLFWSPMHVLSSLPQSWNHAQAAITCEIRVLTALRHLTLDVTEVPAGVTDAKVGRVRRYCFRLQVDELARFADDFLDPAQQLDVAAVAGLDVNALVTLQEEGDKRMGQQVTHHQDLYIRVHVLELVEVHLSELFCSLVRPVLLLAVIFAVVDGDAADAIAEDDALLKEPSGASYWVLLGQQVPHGPVGGVL